MKRSKLSGAHHALAKPFSQQRFHNQLKTTAGEECQRGPGNMEGVIVYSDHKYGLTLFSNLFDCGSAPHKTFAREMAGHLNLSNQSAAEELAAAGVNSYST